GNTGWYIQIVVKDDCGYNKAPTIEGPYTYKVCEGENLTFKIYTDDETFSPYQTVPDTTSMSWNAGIPGATFTLASKASYKDGRKAWATFSWTPAVGMASDIAYSFTVQVNDEHCPKPSIGIRGFKIKVNPRATDTRTYTQLTCGRLAFAAKIPNDFEGVAQFKWSVRDSTGMTELLYSAKQKDTLVFTKGGKYIVVHTVNNPFNCPTIYRDTLIIPDPPKVVLAMADTFACYKTNFTLTADVSNAKPSYKYQWLRVPILSASIDTLTGIYTLTPKWTAQYSNAADTLSTLTLSPIDRDSILSIIVTDGDGCKLRDTVQVFVKPLPLLNIGPDQRICTYE
ncbi:MAG: hypothetical protein ACO3GK_09135, partial [Bacteroidia bacterium]